MKVLLVEDDKKIAAAVAARAVGRGFGSRWRSTATTGCGWRRGALRRHRPRPDAARTQRLPDLRRAARGRRLDADPRADGEGRRPRRGRGPGHRRRRLLSKPFSFPCSSPGSGASPAQRRARPEAASPPAAAARAERAPRLVRRTPRSPSPPANTTSSSSSYGGPADAVQGGDPRRRLGLDFVGDPNIVEVYIGRLRRKLALTPGYRDVRGAATASTAMAADEDGTGGWDPRRVTLVAAVRCRRARERRRARRASAAGARRAARRDPQGRRHAAAGHRQHDGVDDGLRPAR